MHYFVTTKGVIVMANTTNLNIRVDEELKRRADAIFSELGLNMSTAMNMFLRHAVRYGGIPFELRIEKPNAETIAAIDDVDNNRNVSKSFHKIRALMDDLNA
jgi:DNA-damage-inducible protein J